METKSPQPVSRSVRIRRSTAHRAGKTVIVLEEFAPRFPDPALRQLASELRHACGSGGTHKADTIEIQGEHLDRIRILLTERGFRVRG